MDEQRCKDCAHYRRHYTFDQRRIFQVYCGHCTVSKAKRRLPDAAICEQFVPGDPDVCAFASKEYLSKELLQYLLHLELLPKIENTE